MRVWFCLIALPVLAVGCAFNNGIALQFSGTGPVAVHESFTVHIEARHVAGITRRPGQVVRAECALTIVYDVSDEAGPAVLAQTVFVHLRSARLRRRTRYEVDCTDPLVVELPADASNIAAKASAASGEIALPVQAQVASLPLAKRKRLVAEPGMQLAVVETPSTLPAGDYSVELDFDRPNRDAFTEKAIYAASITCGRSTYLQPLVPPTTSMTKVPGFDVTPSADQSTILLPHLIGADAPRANVTVRLAC